MAGFESPTLMQENTVVTTIELVEGGNIIRQGHHLTIGYIAYDEVGEVVDLIGKDLTVSIWGRKGIAFEADAVFEDGVLRFTLDQALPSGDYNVEFTATLSTDTGYRKKYPTNANTGRISVKQSADDLGAVGISIFTIDKFEKKQKELQDAYHLSVDSKVSTLEADFEQAVGALTVDSEVVLARGDASTLRARLDAEKNAVTAQLADKAGKSELQQISLSYKESYATLTDLQTAYPTGDAYNHTVLADDMIYTYADGAWVSTGIQANGTGIVNKAVTEEKLNDSLIATISKLNSVAFKKDVRNPYRLNGKPALGTNITVEYLFDTEGTGATQSTMNLNLDYFTTSSNLNTLKVSFYQNNDPTPSGAANGYGQSVVLDDPLVKNADRNINRPTVTNLTQYRYKHLFIEFTMASTAVVSEVFLANASIDVSGVKLPIINVGKHRMNAESTLTQEWHALYANLEGTPNLFSDVKSLRVDVDEIQTTSITKTRFDGLKSNHLGDSITDPNHLVDVVKYFTVLQNELKLATVRPYGIASSTIARGSNTGSFGPMCERYLTMDDDADLVTVFAGTNDYGYSDAIIGEFYNADGTINKTISTFYGACHTLFEGLVTKYADRGTTILVMTPLPRQSITAPNPTTGLHLKDYVRIIKEVAAYYSLPVLDLFEESGLQSRVPAIKTKYVPDGVHPNTLGHEVLANRLIGKLKTL